MPKGSPRPNAGRRGQYDVKADWLTTDGMSPLETLLQIMRSVEAPLKLRAWAAKEAAPYMHAKLGQKSSENEVIEPVMSQGEAEWARDLDVRPPN